MCLPRPACVVVSLVLAAAARGEVVGVEIRAREPVAGNRAYGAAGPYERITGRLCFEVDPSLAANRGIVDLALAPRTSRGRVAFSAEFFLLAPRDPARGNGCLLYDVNNRGNKLALAVFNGARGNNPATAADMGNSFLLREGYTLLWSGWNGDVSAGGDRLLIDLPVAAGVTGRVYSEICVDRPADSAPLCPGESRVYPAIDAGARSAELTLRPFRAAPPTVLPPESWGFGRVENGSPAADPARLRVEGGLRPGWLYDLVYTARDPRISGLGFAAVRDAVSFFRTGGEPRGPRANPLGGTIRRTCGFGVSQSGRFLQDYLYHGFNADEQGRTVFDGLFVHVAGAGRILLNQRFAQVTRHGSPHEDQLCPTDVFPFTTVPEEDPLTHRRGDWLSPARQAGHLPRIFLVLTSSEYWARGGSLVHTDAEGRRDVGLDPAVRLYHVAGAQHLFAPPADQGICRYPLNRLDYTPLMRALLGRLDAWIARSETPPPSVYPRIADGTLVPRSVYAERFPGIPGVQVPSAPYAPLRLDLGPRWLTEGIADLLPPRAGPPYAVLVPAVDADGNELPGIRLPQIAVPLATCVGWNARAPEFGAPGAMARWIGSQWPFPITPADRARARDPRASILERYPTRADYARRIEAAARDLQRRGLLLQEDVEGMVEAANRRDEWQRAATQPRP